MNPLTFTDAVLIVGVVWLLCVVTAAVVWYIFIPPRCICPGRSRMKLARSEYDPYGAYVRVWQCPKCGSTVSRRIPTK